jgi:hypothetical protein
VSDDYETRQRDHDLAEIRYHYGRAYEVGWEDGTFWFRRRDNGGTLQCSTAAALLAEIRADYGVMPVSREFPAHARAPRQS